jgi:hypothetical protein
MWWHEELNLSFLASPKSGSTSLKAIIPLVGFKKHPMTNHHESALIPGMDYFCVIRNHFDAITSWCFYARRIEGPPFDLDNLRVFVRDHPHYFGGWPLFEGFRADMTAMWRWVGTDYNPTVLRFEEFPKCVEDFLAEKGIELPEMPHVNKSVDREGRHHSEVLPPNVVQWIWDRWGREIEELGYNFEEN